MGLLEWIILITVSLVIFFIGFAGVTGSYMFDRDQEESKNNSSED